MHSLYVELTFEKDREELDLCGALDSKAGIHLALVAVLGAITSTLLADNQLPHWIAVAQAISLLAIGASGALSFWSLVPREYEHSCLPAKHVPWMKSVTDWHGSDVEKAHEEFVSELVPLAEARIQKNHALNKAKSKWLTWSFYPSIFALLVDLVCLVAVASAMFLA